jgi:hypothetical protein
LVDICGVVFLCHTLQVKRMEKRKIRRMIEVKRNR